MSDSPAEITVKNDVNFLDKAVKYAPSEIYSAPKAEDKPVQLTLNSPTAPAVKEKNEPVIRKSEIFVSREDAFKSFMKDYIPVNSGIKSPLVEDKSKNAVDDLGSFKYISEKSLEKKSAGETKEKKTEEIPPITVIGEAFKTYILAQCGTDILLIDKHAAHERLIYERLRKSDAGLDMQMLVVPLSVTMSYEGYDALLNNKSAWERLGLGIEFLSAPEISVYGSPLIAEDMDAADLVTKLADCLALGKKNEGTEIFDDLYHSIACKAAIKANSDTDKLELSKLVELITEEDLRYCPHGRPILVKLTKREIEKMFRRIV